jgi:2-oxoglutarate-Fe(II)-dependent oxygenase superfamily protein
MIELERTTTSTATSGVSAASAGEVEGLRGEFAARHAVLIPGLVGPELLAEVRSALESAPFVQRDYDGLAGELALDESVPLVARMLFLLNDPRLFGPVSEICACGPLARFDGRIYRREASPEHYDNWHDDLHDPNHLVAMSVNLGGAYGGGVLQLRRKGTQDRLVELHNTGAGDAILFRIAPELEHRVGAVESGVKTALAGWFAAGPPWPLPVA